jgi:hypothetical protein
MEITPEWVAIVLTALGMGGAAGVWIERRIQAARDVMPIVRTRWTSGPSGHTAKVTLVNRLNEDLHVTSVHAKARLMKQTLEYDPGGSIVQSTLTPLASTVPLDWHILAGQTAAETFWLEGGGSVRWLRLTINSSAGTLRSKRMTIRDNHIP